MLVKTLIAGFGGQGVLMMGYSLAHAAMNQGFYVTYLPAYGAEMRGGTANCTVAISNEEIASPIASAPDYLIIMNKPSLYTFQNRAGSGGSIFINSSIIDARPARTDVTIHEVPAGDIAEQLGNARVCNIVMMGVYLKKTGLITPDSYLKSLRQIMGERKKAIMEANRQAFAAGFDLKLSGEAKA